MRISLVPCITPQIYITACGTFYRNFFHHDSHLLEKFLFFTTLITKLSPQVPTRLWRHCMCKNLKWFYDKELTTMLISNACVKHQWKGYFYTDFLIYPPTGWKHIANHSEAMTDYLYKLMEQTGLFIAIETTRHLMSPSHLHTICWWKPIHNPLKVFPCNRSSSWAH